MDNPPHGRTQYEITIEGQLDNRWSEWFEGLDVSLPAEAITLLSGPLADQAALLGVLKKIHNLGLPLISVRRVKTV